MLLPRGTIAADGRHVRNVIRRSDASDYFYDNLCPLPGAVASCQIIQTSPTNAWVGTTKMTTGNILIYDRVQEGDILVVEAG